MESYVCTLILLSPADGTHGGVRNQIIPHTPTSYCGCHGVPTAGELLYGNLPSQKPHDLFDRLQKLVLLFGIQTKLRYPLRNRVSTDGEIQIPGTLTGRPREPPSISSRTMHRTMHRSRQQIHMTSCCSHDHESSLYFVALCTMTSLELLLVIELVHLSVFSHMTSSCSHDHESSLYFVALCTMTSLELLLVIELV